jgi:hypothetical protein
MQSGPGCSKTTRRVYRRPLKRDALEQEDDGSGRHPPALTTHPERLERANPPGLERWLPGGHGASRTRLGFWLSLSLVACRCRAVGPRFRTFSRRHRPRGGPIIDGRQWCLRPSSKALRALGSWRWRDVARGDPMLYRIGAAEGGVSSNDELRAPCPRFLEAEAEMLACAGKHPAKLGPTRDRDDLDRDHGWGAIPDDAEAITPMPEAITPPSDESPTRGARPSP